jgi:hypothetical protein
MWIRVKCTLRIKAVCKAKWSGVEWSSTGWIELEENKVEYSGAQQCL